MSEPEVLTSGSCRVHFNSKMPELPEYIVRPKASRIVVSQVIITFFLAVLFYVGIVINLNLLGLPLPSSVRWLIIAVLLLLVIVQGLLSYLQSSKIQYAIYKNRVEILGPKPKYIMFNTIQNITSKHNFFDKIFNTGTIILGPNFTCRAVPHFEQMIPYLNQMIQYSRTQVYQ